MLKNSLFLQSGFHTVERKQNLPQVTKLDNHSVRLYQKPQEIGVNRRCQMALLTISLPAQESLLYVCNLPVTSYAKMISKVLNSILFNYVYIY